MQGPVPMLNAMRERPRSALAMSVACRVPNRYQPERARICPAAAMLGPTMAMASPLEIEWRPTCRGTLMEASN